MKTQLIDIAQVKANPNNPRVIKDDAFRKLVASIKEFPEMLDIRPIVVNGDMVVLGGNMRLRACKEAGMKKIPIIKAEELTEEQQRQFIIKDNVSGGEWDWEMLANEWEQQDLSNWGLDVQEFDNDMDIDGFFEESNVTREKPHTIVLEYTAEEHEQVKAALAAQEGTAEQVVWRLLGL